MTDVGGCRTSMCPEGIDCNQWQSVAISGNQWQSVAISGTSMCPEPLAST